MVWHLLTKMEINSLIFLKIKYYHPVSSLLNLVHDYDELIHLQSSDSSGNEDLKINGYDY